MCDAMWMSLLNLAVETLKQTLTHLNLIQLDHIFTAKQCPYNMIYEESGSPCMDTCALDTSSLCEDHKIDGCFCPPGQCLFYFLLPINVLSALDFIVRECSSSCQSFLLQELCLMTFPWEAVSLNLNVSASTTKSITLVRSTDRTERSGMSEI